MVQETYQNSLKYYHDLNNVVDTSRQEGMQEGFSKGKAEGREEGRESEARSLIARQLSRRIGSLPDAVRLQLDPLPLAALEILGEALLDFAGLADLQAWLQAYRQQDEE